MNDRNHVRSDTFDFVIHRSDSAVSMRQAHRHQEVEINYLESGEATYLIGGRLEKVIAGRFCFFWGAVPHQLIETEATSTGFWYLTLPLAWVLRWELSPQLLERLFDGALLCDAQHRAGDPGRFAEWLHAIHGADRRAEKPAMLELEARFRRFALDNPSTTAARRRAHETPAALSKVETLARCIVEHYREPLTLADIAAAAGVHPNYAANLFKRQCGQTLLQCLTQHRVAHAQRLLATTDAKVIDIAYDSGFGSVSRFHEAFVRLCGVSPLQYRRRFDCAQASA